ncbi:hypothetical protein [Streptomyces sp. NPDC059455]
MPEPQLVRALGSGLIAVSPMRTSRIIQDHVNASHLQRGAERPELRG